MITAQTDLQTLYDMTVMKAATLVLSGEKFKVRDLWPEIEWKRIPVVVRSQLGSMFFAYVKGNPGLYEPSGKTTQKQQLYIKL